MGSFKSKPVSNYQGARSSRKYCARQSKSIICSLNNTFHGTVYREGSSVKLLQEGKHIGTQHGNQQLIMRNLQNQQVSQFVVWKSEHIT
jgi:hypothetical protein